MARLLLDGKPLEASSRLTNFGYVALTITIHNRGVYTCVARNALGEARTAAKLTVISKQDILLDTQHPEGLEKIRYLEDDSRYARKEDVPSAAIPRSLTNRTHLLSPPADRNAQQELIPPTDWPGALRAPPNAPTIPASMAASARTWREGDHRCLCALGFTGKNCQHSHRLLRESATRWRVSSASAGRDSLAPSVRTKSTNARPSRPASKAAPAPNWNNNFKCTCPPGT